MNNRKKVPYDHGSYLMTREKDNNPINIEPRRTFQTAINALKKNMRVKGLRKLYSPDFTASIYRALPVTFI